MDKQRTILRTLLAVAFGAFGASAFAQVTESELLTPPVQNHPITSAQVLTLSGGSVSVRGTVGKFGTVQDVDFFAFDVKATDIVKVDIGGTTNSFDTSVWLFGPGPTFTRRAFSMDAPLDGNSTCDCDPRIDAFTIDVTGRWVVGVTADSATLSTGGIMRGSAFSNGGYTLTITVTTAELPVFIDIKPGSPESPINPKAKGTIPVAILSQDNFNPFDVDPTTLTFGQTGDENSFRRCVPSESRDVNGDGKPDLVCQFDNEATGFVRGDSMGVLKGKTKGGQAFKGTGDLKVVPEKREK